ncbi:MAG: hypothetical protein ACOY4I_06590 [Bacillota bacterium]
MDKTWLYDKFHEPETIKDLHRPPGSPMPREAKSQKAQLESTHKHGTKKDVKRDISSKTGYTEE